MSKHSNLAIGIILLLTILLSACGDGDSASGGDPKRGEELYNQTTIGEMASPGCATCHLYNAFLGEDTIATYTAGVGTRAASRIPDMSAEDYLRQSILDPDAFIVDGYAGGVMFSMWENYLTDQEIYDLVAYMLTEK